MLARLHFLLLALRHWWKEKTVTVKTASAYVLLFTAAGFLLGGYRPPSDYHRLESELSAARQDMRLFADEIARRNGLLNNMHARDNLNKKMISLLSDSVKSMQNESLNLSQEAAFYRHILQNNNPSGELIIHALDVNPDFNRQIWEISAILARPNSRREFTGSYYFEASERKADGTYQLTRLPAGGARKFNMTFYHEIRNSYALSPGSEIENVRLVVTRKGRVVASAEYGEREADSGDEPAPDAGT